jgi:hypothetical protein
MSINISKSILSQILFTLCIAVPYLNIYELTFAVWFIACIATLQKNYSLTILKYISFFAVIIAIAFIVMFFNNYKAYYITRDITYMLKPIIGLLLGYQLCKNNSKKAFQSIVYTGVFIASIHLIILLYAFFVHHAVTVNDLRFYGGYFSDFEIYALIILLFSKKFELEFTKSRLYLFITIVGVSSFFYLARTNFIQFGILFVAMKGYFKINKTSIRVILTLILTVIIGYSTILFINPKRNGEGIEAFLYKIKIAPIEPFKTKINVENWKDFNDNYRSYENILTVKQVTNKGTTAVIFGEGIGSKIDLKREVYLGDMMLRYISILHNGYMTVFLKSGLLGVLVYLYFIYSLFRQIRSEILIIQTINLLFVGTAVFLILSSWVFMGVYNLLDNKSILIGFIICYREITIKKAITENRKND